MTVTEFPAERHAEQTMRQQMLTVELAERAIRRGTRTSSDRDSYSDTGAPTGPSMPAGPGAPPRRRSRSRNLRRPPSGLVPVSYALAASASVVAEGEASGIRPYRMSRRARLAITVTVVAAGLVIGLTAALSTGAVGTTTVTVTAGDSLWSIAQRVAPDAEVWSIVDEITDLNGLSSSTVYPGQTLVVPVP